MKSNNLTMYIELAIGISEIQTCLSVFLASLISIVPDHHQSLNSILILKMLSRGFRCRLPVLY